MLRREGGFTGGRVLRLDPRDATLMLCERTSRKFVGAGVMQWRQLHMDACWAVASADGNI